jgi:hypothetical protein
MPRCAFLTIEDASSFFVDDDFAQPPLSKLGWRVESIPWRRAGVVWSEYDAVVIRSTWDYTADPDGFLEVLGEIERAGTRLFNGLDLVRWNVRKTYLRELAERGVPIVPTVWRDRLRPGELRAVLEEVGGREAVIKPVVGAGARGAYRIDGEPRSDQASEIEAHYADRALMAQPFVSSVTEEGEFSLFYFNGELSHSILKTPKPADFRVQPEHGGLIRAVEPEAALRAAGGLVLDALGEAPLYARADFVRADGGAGFWLMELELIEPSLYFRMDAEAPERFARALHERVSPT